MGAEQFGDGGSRRIPKGKIQKSKKAGVHGKKGCCPMVAAVRSVKQGRFRLARRYAAMSVRLITARVG